MANWSLEVYSLRGSVPVPWGDLRSTGPVPAGFLPAVNVIGMQLRDSINSDMSSLARFSL